MLFKQNTNSKWNKYTNITQKTYFFKSYATIAASDNALYVLVIVHSPLGAIDSIISVDTNLEPETEFAGVSAGTSTRSSKRARIGSSESDVKSSRTSRSSSSSKGKKAAGSAALTVSSKPIG